MDVLIDTPARTFSQVTEGRVPVSGELAHFVARYI